MSRRLKAKVDTQRTPYLRCDLEDMMYACAKRLESLGLLGDLCDTDDDTAELVEFMKTYEEWVHRSGEGKAKG